jgi:hypothetical protein
MERFNPEKLNKVGVKEKHWAALSNRFTDLENLHYNVDINTAWET